MQKGNGISLPGVYSLVISLHRKTTIIIGALGSQTFLPGHYVYTGSALGPGGLRARLKHHMNKNKSYSHNIWHIDFLLAHENATLTGIIAAETEEKLECEVNKSIKEEERAKIPVPGFGSSDCKKNCGSHLLFFPDIIQSDDILIRKLVKLYAHFTSPIIVLYPTDLNTRSF